MRHSHSDSFARWSEIFFFLLRICDMHVHQVLLRVEEIKLQLDFIEDLSLCLCALCSFHRSKKRTAAGIMQF